MPMCYLTWFLANCPIFRHPQCLQIGDFFNEKLADNAYKVTSKRSPHRLFTEPGKWPVVVWPIRLAACPISWMILWPVLIWHWTNSHLMPSPPPMLPMVFIRMLTDSWKLDGEGTDIGKFTVCGLMSSKGSAWQIVPQNVLATNRIPIGT